MEQDPDLINDPDRALEAKSVGVAEKYQQTRIQSQIGNKKRADGRKEIANLGFDTDSFQVALRVSRDKTPAEQKKWLRDLRFFLKAFGGKQMELWPEDAARAEARAKRKREREAKKLAAAGKETPEQQERRLAADAIARSDPKRGGAGRASRKAKENVEKLNRAPLADAPTTVDPAVAESEQKIGGDILDGALEQMKEKGLDTSGLKPVSQSEIARKKLDDAGMA